MAHSSAQTLRYSSLVRLDLRKCLQGMSPPMGYATTRRNQNIQSFGSDFKENKRGEKEEIKKKKKEIKKRGD